MSAPHRLAVLTVAAAAALAGLWLLTVAVPDLIDRHRDGALAAALALVVAVPAGLVWGAARLVDALEDDRHD